MNQLLSQSSTSDTESHQAAVVANLSEVLETRDKLTFNSLYVLSHLIGEDRVSQIFGKTQSRYNQRIATSLSQSKGGSKGKSISVDERADISPENFMEQYVIPGRPLVLKGLAADWKAVKAWDLDFFEQNYGDSPALLVNSKYLTGKDGEETFEESDLRGVINSIRNKGNKYARFHPLLERYPELLNDYDLDWVNSHMVGRRPKGKTIHNIFIGGEGNKTHMHAARSDNLFLQAEGTKRWTLWPSDYNYLCASDSNRSIFKTTSLDADKPDLSKFPAYEFADYYETTIDPGDILYIPGYTWHQVSNVTDSIGCGMRWFSPETSFRHDRLKSIMMYFSTNPSVFNPKKYLEAGGIFDFNRLITPRMAKVPTKVN